MFEKIIDLLIEDLESMESNIEVIDLPCFLPGNPEAEQLIHYVLNH